MPTIKAASFDPSLTHWGIALITIDLETAKFDIDDLKLIKTAPEKKNKKIRASSDYLRRAGDLHKGIIETIGNRRLLFSEVPSGGKDYKSVYGFGIVVGLLASMPRKIVQIMPTEAKKAAVGTNTASKEEMMEWAYEAYPDAPWLTHKSNGEIVRTGSNEHLADAVAIAKAGIESDQFQQLREMLKAAA